jgi:hypothetical protein
LEIFLKKFTDAGFKANPILCKGVFIILPLREIQLLSLESYLKIKLSIMKGKDA